MTASISRPLPNRQADAAYVEPVDQLTELERRLTHGWTLIEKSRDAGDDVHRWEDSWLRLLRQYEALYDAVA